MATLVRILKSRRSAAHWAQMTPRPAHGVYGNSWGLVDEPMDWCTLMMKKWFHRPDVLKQLLENPPLQDMEDLSPLDRFHDGVYWSLCNCSSRVRA